MILTREDGDLYYRLWRPLLDFVNQKYHVNRNLKNIATEGDLDPADVKEVADKLWSEIEVIDLYLEKHPEIEGEERTIIQGWKRRIQGRFIMERHLKKGSIFISIEDSEVYQVKGIRSSWEELFYGAPMPLMLEATLIPFRDVIISDGLVMTYNVFLGSGMRKEVKDIYMAAKRNGEIHRTI